jgi:iron uptake system component EfeO
MSRALGVAGGLAAVLVLAGCGGSAGADPSSGARTISVTITDAGCRARPSKAQAGPATFEVRNDGAEKVSEVELVSGNSILGEAEGIAPGLSGKFSVTLRKGKVQTYCPGADQERWPFVVAGGSGSAGLSSTAAVAVRRYRTYLEDQTALLVARTAAFTTAVREGRLADAKRLYVQARIPYERIEPVAESFGSLDPAIDARAGDVPAAQWTGFHPMEKAMWIRGTTGGLGPLASKLQADVKDLQRRVRRVKLEPAQIANGSVELLGEVSKSKITGEEERYSHTDLDDFEANVDGSRTAYESVRKIVAAEKPALAAEIDRRFGDVSKALAPYRRGAGFVAYTALTPADTRKLSQAIDALAEPLSRVGAIVVSR